MEMLVPATADAVLTDREMGLCLRHYVGCQPVRPWVRESDSPPGLIWHKQKEVARSSEKFADALDASSAPAPLPASNTRWRDRYLQLHLPKATDKSQQRTGASSAAAGAETEREYIVICEDDREAEERSSATPPQRPAESAASASRSRTTASPPPRRSGGGAGISASQGSRASQRHSTGSSVVIVSQPTKKAVDAAAENAQRRRSAPSKSASRGREQGEVDEAGKKRQRTMEEFVYRDT
ncbi:hypothetical protein ABL78_1059 [Leptomonas seymouri]|uniref:Uncharacterized protein n=1 Tax=Leptomonas seymouri TaxID=5684 RepID=A0A0N0P8C8_LEPSE|nr:hypothetical protein ABL78_1059 [Leptomonas seymouri]|eukprot:KPI89796.1 hypothetical protein ABL78_1059 [Leptomonas seymouri]